VSNTFFLKCKRQLLWPNRDRKDTLRHYFISQCNAKIDLLAIARWVGHRGIKMIEGVHGHLLTEYCQEQMSKVRIVGMGSDGGAKP
jgi:integrase